MPDEDIEALKAEIEALKKEKKAKEELRDLKLEKLKGHIGNLPVGFAAKHPVISWIAKNAGKAAVKGTELTGKGIIEAAKYAAKNSSEARRLEKQRRQLRRMRKKLNKERKRHRLVYAYA